uniref:DNA-directed primase/polymerase protein n=1 Tax=Globisporangium ultimum (strain ATCC 200006 / CBS 805.95 / DAOM BR144) TaxID=431595 RepID=K3WHZ0_GLOUD
MPKHHLAPCAVFESACRVWTGPRTAALEAITDATDHALDVLPGRVQLWTKRTPPQRGVFLVRKQLRRRGTDAYDENAPLYLASEGFRPSPLSATVLVSVDIGESLQQCYFFDSLTRVLQSRQQAEGEEDQDLYSSGSIETATEFLTILHEAFADVPLAANARDLLSRATIEKATTPTVTLQNNRPGASIRAKRRKTLTASTFYGRNDAVSAMMTAPPTPASEHASDSESAWTRFYEKLQFRVSTSFLCQLEGTAAVSSVFPRQQEAFEFADQIRAFRQRMRRHHHAQDTTQLEVPRVFSFEDAREGTRRFLVSSFESFWANYTSTKPDQRHVYEIIREGVPCRLYFDLEFKKACNPLVNGDELVERLVSLVQLQLYRKYGIHATREAVVQLDSSTNAKFSRHLIFHLPQGELFADNIHAGNFIREFIHALVANPRDQVDEVNDHPSPFLVSTGQQRPIDDAYPESNNTGDHNRSKQLFIDVGVYTRNRMFRVLGSSKYRRDAILKPMPTAQTQAAVTTAGDDALDRNLFLQSLVCPFPTLSSMETHFEAKKQRQPRLLYCDAEYVSTRSYGERQSSVYQRNTHSASVECRHSMFPKLDAFILTISNTGGVQGEIRAIHMLFDNVNNVILPSDNFNDDFSQNEELRQQKKKHPWMVIYQMARNRWCWNVRRAHKSNNVMFVVDLDQRVVYQKCHDQQCKAIDYRSPPQPLPPDLLVES